jgi:hypothetical protein
MISIAQTARLLRIKPAQQNQRPPKFAHPLFERIKRLKLGLGKEEIRDKRSGRGKKRDPHGPS